MFSGNSDCLLHYLSRLLVCEPVGDESGCLPVSWYCDGQAHCPPGGKIDCMAMSRGHYPDTALTKSKFRAQKFRSHHLP